MIGNQVFIKNGVFHAYVRGAYVNATSGDAIAAYNRVTMSGGLATNYVFAAAADAQAGNALTLANELYISGGTIETHATAGWANTVAGLATSSFGVVHISGGHILQRTEGGYANSDSGDASSVFNSVTISGGTFDGNIYGGTADAANYAQAIYNTVTLLDNPILSTAILFGGSATSAAGTIDDFTGNTLNILNRGIVAKGVGNFANYNFNLPADTVSGDTIFRVTTNTNISESTIGLQMNGQAPLLNAGAKITLLNTSGNLITANNINNKAQVSHGISRIYEFDIFTDANNLYASVGEIKANPQLPALMASDSSALITVAQSAKIVGSSIKNALQQTSAMKNSENKANANANANSNLNSDANLTNQTDRSNKFNNFNGANHAVKQTFCDDVDKQNSLAVVGFGEVSGSNLHYKSLLPSDVKSRGFVAGIAAKNPCQNEGLLLGAFIEAGDAKYQSQNHFANAPSVQAEGAANYLGAGVLAHYQFANGFYTETSLRAGRIKSDYQSDIQTGENTQFETAQTYVGGHFGAGFEWVVNDNLSADFSGAYAWNWLENANVHVAGDEIKFASSFSENVRGGVRLNYALPQNARLMPYAALDYEYELGGTTKALAKNAAGETPFSTPRHKGGAWIFGLGLVIKPTLKQNLSLQFGAEKTVGKREGFGGNLQLIYRF